jgi:nitrogen regulatory protein P-II 1
MKLVTAMVKPDRLDDVAAAVSAAGAGGLTATEARGFGQQHGHQGQDRRAGPMSLVAKLRIDVLTSDELAWPVAEAIAAAAATGSIGDGKLWITPVEGAVRVRTGERGQAAL